MSGERTCPDGHVLMRVNERLWVCAGGDELPPAAWLLGEYGLMTAPPDVGVWAHHLVYAHARALADLAQRDGEITRLRERQQALEVRLREQASPARPVVPPAPVPASTGPTSAELTEAQQALADHERFRMVLRRAVETWNIRADLSDKGAGPAIVSARRAALFHERLRTALTGCDSSAETSGDRHPLPSDTALAALLDAPADPYARGPARRTR